MSAKVAVVIPVYKEELNELEKISLEQCRKVLGKYRIVFVAPKGKKFSYFAKGDVVAYFSPKFFQSVSTYSRLMMSPGFYNAFKNFDYILIYQLDAFVFYDRLEYFCSLGYDYIGAPWPRMYRKNWIKTISCVGNGGFSLRNVKAHYELLLKYPEEISKWHEKNWPEDVFFSYCGRSLDQNFQVAPINVAYKFSAEYNPARVVKKNGNNLPFGCHDWHRKNPKFYIKIFSQFGYDLLQFQELLKFNDGGLTNWLVTTALQRLVRREQSGQSIIHYLPTNRFASLLVIRHPFAMRILTRLLMEDHSLADKIFFYDLNERDLLLQDLTLQKLPHLLISPFGTFETNLMSAIERKGFAYGKRIVSFRREYLKRCEEIFRNLGK